MGLRRCFKFWCIINGAICPIYFLVAGAIVGSFYKEALGWIVATAPQLIAIPICVGMIVGICDWGDNDSGSLKEWYEKEPEKRLGGAPKMMESGRWRG